MAQRNIEWYKEILNGAKMEECQKERQYALKIVRMAEEKIE